MPQGLSFGVCLPIAPAVSFALGSQRIFCPLAWCSAPPPASCPVALSCVSLRLNSRCWLRSRTPSRLASPGLWSLLVLVAPLLLPMLVHPQLPLLTQRPQRLRWCLRPVTRWQLLCCAPHSLPFSCAAAQTCTASQFQRRLWLAWIGCSRGVGTGHGLGHQELPTGPASSAAPFPRLSRSPRCLTRLAAICRRLWALCTLRPGL